MTASHCLFLIFLPLSEVTVQISSVHSPGHSTCSLCLYSDKRCTERKKKKIYVFMSLSLVIVVEIFNTTHYLLVLVVVYDNFRRIKSYEMKASMLQ